MLRSALLFALAAVGCQTTTVPLSGPEEILVGAAVDHPATPITTVVRTRPHPLMARLGVGPSSKFVTAFRSWRDGMGVPLEAVESVTLVSGSDGPLCVTVRTKTDVDRAAVSKACNGLIVKFDGSRNFTCSEGYAPPLPAVVRKQFDAAGSHDMIIWTNAIGLKDLSGPATGLRDGFRDGVVMVDVGETLDVSARLNFKDEASAEKGAKVANALITMGRTMVTMVTAQMDLTAAIPEAAERIPDKEQTIVRAQYGLMKEMEPALIACKAVARGPMVSLYMKADVPATKIASAIATMAEAGQVEVSDPTPGVFFKKKAQPAFVAPLQPSDPLVMTLPASTPVAPTYGPPSAYPTPTPMPPPAAAVTLAVANVRKEPVSLFRVVNGSLTFVRKVPAGEAVDVTEFTGTVLAATFADAPHCANYVVPPTAGQTWLLRPAAK